MLASEAIGIFLIVIIFFTFWLTKTFAHAVLGSMVAIILLKLLPFPVISNTSLMITIIIIVVLSAITQFIVSHDQAAQQRELENE
ncbi:MAG: hypothetical protein ACRCWD_03215 [Culicoidibacterales bacterium]